MLKPLLYTVGFVACMFLVLPCAGMLIIHFVKGKVGRGEPKAD